MSEDITKAQRFTDNQNILLPCDDEMLPLSVDTEGERIFWIGFESPELGKKSTAVNLDLYKWGQIDGLSYIKFLHERIVQGGEHYLIINPGTDLQMGMDNEAIKTFLEILGQS